MALIGRLRECLLVHWSLLLAVGFLSIAATVQAQTRAALLVGISNYPKESGATPLRGPGNDLPLVHNLLKRAGFNAENITVLSDTVPGAQPPTRENILGALRRLAAGAKPGDYYYLHFSGHGSQQPVNPKIPARRSEPDGLNEIFLPIDIGRWDGERSTVVNAIVNQELDEILDRFLDKGAFVWAVFDACHSGGLMRGAADDVTPRQVPPEALGIPSALLSQAAAAAPRTRGGPEAPMGALSERAAVPGKSGGFVAFYAAQTTEVAPEMSMPLNLSAGDPQKRPYGVLTFMLAEALSTHPHASYRQLSQYILSRYATQNISNRPTPLFTGTRLDAVAFGAEAGAPVRQWQIAQKDGSLTIPAGLLAQINKGALLALVPNPLAPTEQATAQLEVVDSTMFAAQLRPVTDAAGKTVAAGDVPAGAYARLIRPGLQLSLRVAKPTFEAGAAPARAKVEAAVTTLSDASPPGARIEWQPAGRVADIRLHAEDGQLWLLPASGALVKTGESKTPSIALTHTQAEIASELGDALGRIGKALNLIRIAEQMPRDGAAAQVDVRVTQLAAGKSVEHQLAATGGQLRGGDKLGFTITNRGRGPVDVTILYVDSQYGIEAIFPSGGENNRIEPGAVLRAGPGGLDPIELNETTTGTERLLVIVSSAVAQGERIDYAYLAQPRIERTRGASTTSLFEEMLDEGAFGTSTRGAARQRSEQAVMHVFTWVVGAAKK